MGWDPHLSSGVAEDDGLSDGEGIVQVAEGIKFPFFFLDCDKELLDAFERQFITLDEDANGVGHELGGHLEDIVGQCCTEQHDLGGRGKVSVHVVDLVLETLVQEFVGFVKNQHLDVPRSQTPSPDHVKHPPGRSGYDVLAILQLPDILPN